MKENAPRAAGAQGEYPRARREARPKTTSSEDSSRFRPRHRRRRVAVVVILMKTGARSVAEHLAAPTSLKINAYKLGMEKRSLTYM